MNESWCGVSTKLAEMLRLYLEDAESAGIKSYLGIQAVVLCAKLRRI